MGKALRPLLAFLAVPVFIFLLLWGSQEYVAWSTRNLRFTNTSDISQGDVAVVFGAGVIQKTGDVGVVLKGRMDTAISLYRAGKVKRIVLSGDNVVPSYDEVTPMVKYATSKNIPDADLIADRLGTSTYDTCYRLLHTFGIHKAVLVTNEYHLPRAVYTCRTLGVDVTGVGTPNYPGYETNSTQREPLATIKMFLDLYVAPPKMN